MAPTGLVHWLGVHALTRLFFFFFFAFCLFVLALLFMLDEDWIIQIRIDPQIRSVSKCSPARATSLHADSISYFIRATLRHPFLFSVLFPSTSICMFLLMQLYILAVSLRPLVVFRVSAARWLWCCLSLLPTGHYHGSEGIEIVGSQSHRLLHDGSGRRREVADGPSGSFETNVSRIFLIFFNF